MPFFKDLYAATQKLLEQHDNKAFLEGCMAACAIVAYSDGEISFAERGKLNQIITVVDRLKIYDPDDGVRLFNTYVQSLRNDPKGKHHAKKEVLKKIHDIFQAPSDKKTLLKICWAICKSDGDVVRYEYESIEEIAKQIDMTVRDVFENY
jgi:tellurite resistance protein TerB